MSEIRLIFRNQLAPHEGNEQRRRLRVFVEGDLPEVVALSVSGGLDLDLRFSTPDVASVRWYLEYYSREPIGGTPARAQETEEILRRWAGDLLPAALGPDGPALVARLGAVGALRYLTIESDSSFILGLPWELAAVEGRSLAEMGVLVRRRPSIPESAFRTTVNSAPIARTLRILLVVSRPDEAGYFDHRRTAHIVDEISRAHPGHIVLDICFPATFERLATLLAQASAASRPYGVVHFDGHGVYNSLLRRSELCFESDVDEASHVESDFVTPSRLRAVLERQERPALLLFEACQTSQMTPDLMGMYAAPLATSHERKTMLSYGQQQREHVDLADVMPADQLRENADALRQAGFGALLNERDMDDLPLSRSVIGAATAAGVESIIGMSHTVHIDATAIFIRHLYSGLVAGKSVAESVDCGRLALMQTGMRRTVVQDDTGPPQIAIRDWFVPQLYQAGEDATLEPSRDGEVVRNPIRQLLGRGSDLLLAERLLLRQRAILVRGMSGVGKSEFARNVAIWLERGRRFSDGIFWLGADSPLREVHAIAQGSRPHTSGTVGPEVGDPSTLPPQWPDLYGWLSTHDALLVIDGIERMLWQGGDEADAHHPALSDFVRDCLAERAFAGRLLLTTRLSRKNPITALGVHTIDLQGLATADALDLFGQLMEEEGHGAEWLAMDVESRLELSSRVCGLPGAIQIAARHWPAEAGKATVEALDVWVAEWARRDFAADARGDLGVAARSLRCLPEESRRWTALFAQLRGGFAMPIIGQLNVLSQDAWLPIIASWVDIGLVEPVAGIPVRYKFHPWIPYRLGTSGSVEDQTLAEQVNVAYEVLLTILTDYTCPPFERPFDEWLGAEWATLRLQFARAMQWGKPERALASGLLLDELLERFGLERARSRLLEVLDASPASKNIDIAGFELRLRAARSALEQGQRNRAIEVAVTCLEELDRSGHVVKPAYVARTLVGLATLFDAAAYRHAAAVLYCRAIATWRSIGPLTAQSKRPDLFRAYDCFDCLGELLVGRQLNESVCFEPAWVAARFQHMAFCAAIGTDSMSYRPVLRFAQILKSVGRFDAAESLFDNFLTEPQKLVSDARQWDDRAVAAWNLIRAEIEGKRKRLHESGRLILAALAIGRRHAGRDIVKSAYYHMAMVCIATGRMPEARKWVQAALVYAWKRADTKWIEALLLLLQQSAGRMIEAAGYARAEELVQGLKQELLPEIRTIERDLDLLQKQHQQMDPLVQQALNLGEHSASELPKDFDVEKQILRWLDPTLLATDTADTPSQQGAPTLTDYLLPSTNAGVTAYWMVMTIVEQLIEGKN